MLACEPLTHAFACNRICPCLLQVNLLEARLVWEPMGPPEAATTQPGTSALPSQASLLDPFDPTAPWAPPSGGSAPSGGSVCQDAGGRGLRAAQNWAAAMRRVELVILHGAGAEPSGTAGRALCPMYQGPQLTWRGRRAVRHRRLCRAKVTHCRATRARPTPCVTLPHARPAASQGRTLNSAEGLPPLPPLAQRHHGRLARCVPADAQ